MAGQIDHGATATPATPRTIMIVEDEGMLRGLLSSLLQGNGFVVIEAESGEEALAVFKERGNEIGLVISDMGLPGITGDSLFAKLREIDPSTKVILSTGFVDPQQKAELMRAGACDVIQKPYVTDDLLRRVRELIDQSPR